MQMHFSSQAANTHTQLHAAKSLRRFLSVFSVLFYFKQDVLGFPIDASNLVIIQKLEHNLYSDFMALLLWLLADRNSSLNCHFSSSFELLPLALPAAFFCFLGHERWEEPSGQSVATLQFLLLPVAVFTE